MINMGNNTEVSNIFHFGNFFAGRKYTALEGVFFNISFLFSVFTMLVSSGDQDLIKTG